MAIDHAPFYYFFFFRLGSYPVSAFALYSHGWELLSNHIYEAIKASLGVSVRSIFRWGFYLLDF